MAKFSINPIVKKQIQKILYSLTGKLLLTIGIIMLAGSALFWVFLIRYQETELIRNSVKYGQSFVSFVEKSTRYGMLTFQQPSIQHTVEALGSSEGVVRLRIYDSKGKIAYSSKKEEQGTVLTKDDPVCKNCHGQVAKQADLPTWSIKKDIEGYRHLNILHPIYNESSCYTSACHVHRKDEKILGFIESDISLSLFDKAIQKQESAITAYFIIFIVILSGVLWTVLWRLVSKPLRVLNDGMQRAASGDLDFKLKIETRDEIGELAKAFNAMTVDLSKAKKQIIEWGNILEKKVAENTQEIRTAQAKLIHSEKLASLGRMAAGVAHEINSPLTGIITFGHLLQEKFSEGTQERDDIDVIIEQANRCSIIIKGLLGFARSASMDKTLVNLNDVVNSVLNMIRHKADFLNIKIYLHFSEPVLPVNVDSSQLHQVFLNIIINAADAMEGKGTLTINSRKVKEDDALYAEIEFADTGHGITAENMQKIFEPFFTTKPVGKGTGLGLAVSHGIIQEHGGKITVKTDPGKGTSFFIRLPLYREKS